MGKWIFLGIFAAAALAIAAVFFTVRAKLRRFSREILGTTDLIQGLKALDSDHENTPRSLNGCDSLLLPRILKDFPDFDINQAKDLLRKYLKKQLGTRPEFTVHNIAIARYLPSAAQKTIVFQAAVSYREGDKKLQKRYDIFYAYLLPQELGGVAANCPNCGAALGYGVTVCPYCESRVANALGNSWSFTQMLES